MWFVVLRLFLRAFWSTHFCTIFQGFEGVLGVTVVGCTTANHARTTENRATIRARKKADGTVSDTVQIRLEKNGPSLPRSPGVRPQAGSAGLGEATEDRVGCP